MSPRQAPAFSTMTALRRIPGPLHKLAPMCSHVTAARNFHGRVRKSKRENCSRSGGCCEVYSLLHRTSAPDCRHEFLTQAAQKRRHHIPQLGTDSLRK